MGFAPPARHPDLDAPTCELDRLALALDCKLSKIRADRQDLAEPTNWLAPAAEEDLVAIRSKWQLPETYEEFLRKFSPLKVTVTGRGFGTGLHMLGASELVSGQAGYAYNSTENRPIEDWPSEYLVIGDVFADPHILDLSATKAVDTPVLTAPHGVRVWRFQSVTPTFLAFLRRLAR
ncbi:MAG TPA: SMI1/KNR4 family protein [Candidatus Limnocylindrales bacterium]